jgi:hypothetical protein
MTQPTAGQPAALQGAASVDPLTLLNSFPAPLVVATLPGAEALNAELRRTILARERPYRGTRERISIAINLSLGN